MLKTHLGHQLVPSDDCLRTHAETTQRVFNEDVRPGIVDHELRVEVLKVICDGANQPQVLLIRGRALDWQILDDCFLDISIIGVDSIVIAINNIDALVQHEIPLVAIPLMCIKIYYHNSLDSVPRLQVMHCQRDVRVDAESTPTVETGMMKTT